MIPFSTLFSIKFLVLSFNESYLVSPIDEGIEKIDVSLHSLGFEEMNIKFIPDINPIINSHTELHPYIDKILKSSFLIRFFHNVYFGLNDLNKKWYNNTVLLVFSIDKSLLNNPFYDFLLYEFHHYVQFGFGMSYNSIYRIAEDAAIMTLWKTLPINCNENLSSDDFQRKFVILDLITRTIGDISALYYESSQCKGYFQFINNKEEFHGIELKNKLTFYGENDRIIRKLLEAAKSFPLVILDDRIIGIATEELTTADKYTIHILGHLTWEYRINDVTQFVYVDSMYKFPSSNASRSKVENTLERLFSINKNEIANFLDIVCFACKGHGAIIIVANNANSEAKRLCKLNRGILVNPFRIFDVNQQTITDLTSIDGAIMLDNSGHCYAFGVILDGRATIPGAPSRGARYNSAKNYIALKAKGKSDHKFMAVVISEDGMIDVFASDSTDFTETNRNYFSRFNVFNN